MSLFGKKAPEAETTEQAPRRSRWPRMKVWQRLFAAAGMLLVLAMLATPYVDFQDPRWAVNEEELSQQGSGFRNPVTGYVVAPDGEVAAQLYSVGLSPWKLCGRGTALEMESWEPYIAENGVEYYAIYHDGRFGYILCDNVASEPARVLQESLVYVRTTTNLLRSDTSTRLGSLVEKGTVLRILDYDYIRANGQVNRYQVQYGEETGWISSQYVSLTFVDSMANWTNDTGTSYAQHVERGDRWGAGDAADLDYFPWEKGDFSAQGNAMPESCYSLYIPAFSDCIENIDRYLALAEGTEINTFVFTIQDDSNLAYPSQTYADLGIDGYSIHNSAETYAEAIRKVKEAGYYTVARMTVFQDQVLAAALPGLSFANLDGSLGYIHGIPWPSPFSRDAWKIKADFALEAVERFDFDEIQLDCVQFPSSTVNLLDMYDFRNEYNESMAQALQRFLMYITELLHNAETYVGVMVYGQTSEAIVTEYGLYWPAISCVVDVMSATPYPESYGNYYSKGEYYRSYQHPYSILSSFASKVSWRQKETGNPAVVRTWIQAWDNTYYEYNAAAVEREILALFDNGITGGYMPWNYEGSLSTYEKLLPTFQKDYYSLWQEAEAAGQALSTYLNISTDDSTEIRDPDE